jgi:hypothetical protein
MKKTSKRLLALLCAALLALPLLLAHPVARAGELVESYDHWTKYGRYKDPSNLLKEPTISSPEVLCKVPANESMMITSLWKTSQGQFYYVLYRKWDTGEDIYGFAHPYVIEVQSEPYPWSWPIYGRQDLYAVKEDNTLWYKTPWRRLVNIGGKLNKGHLFRVYTSGANMFDAVPYTDWLRVSDTNTFIVAEKASYVGPILETTNKLITPVPEVFPKGESPGLDGMFTTNWPIKSVDITITVRDETIFTYKQSSFPPGKYSYTNFFDNNKLLELPARYDAYKLNITATVAAPNWPYPEETIPIVKDMDFQIYQPATKVSFEHEEITAMPGETFDNPVLMEPDNATYPNYYTLKVEDNTIAKVEQDCPARFTALKEGSTRVFVHTIAPNADTSAFFQLTVKRQTPDGLQYRIDGGEATITGYSPDGDYWLVIVPDKVEGVPVTSIGGLAFLGASNMTHIVLPDSISSIGKGAFWECWQLESIVIPAGVTSIENSTFNNCHSLSSVTLPAGVTSIGNDAFAYCSGLTSITLPIGLTSIEANAFLSCRGLTSITLPASVTSIGGSAFSGCRGLTSITLPASVTSIGGSAFTNCSKLTSITIPKSVTSIGADAFTESPVTIHGYLNSKAHQYATDNNIKFVALDAPPPLPGDANLDGKVNIQDLESLINYLVKKTPCKSMDNADANGDKTVDIKDVKWIIDKIVGI